MLELRPEHGRGLLAHGLHHVPRTSFTKEGAIVTSEQRRERVHDGIDDELLPHRKVDVCDRRPFSLQGIERGERSDRVAQAAIGVLLRIAIARGGDVVEAELASVPRD